MTVWGALLAFGISGSDAIKAFIASPLRVLAGLFVMEMTLEFI